MIGKMPKALADTLVEIRNWGVSHGLRVPPAQVLADRLGIGLENAKRRIYRIERDPHYLYFKKVGRMRLLDEKRFLTEELTAQICLLLSRECLGKGEGLAERNTFAEYAATYLSECRGQELTEATVLRLIEHAGLGKDYITSPLGREDFIRPGARFGYEEEYIKGIAGDVGQKIVR